MRVGTSIPTAGPARGSLTSRLPRRGEQIGDGHSESMCKLRDVEERDVAERALDATDVGSMQIRFLRQALLRPTSLGAQFANPLREALDGLVCNDLVIGPQASSSESGTL